MNNISQKSLNELSEELFNFLDDSILSIRRMLEQLTELRAAVIRRDEKTLRLMSEEMPELASQRVGMRERQQRLCEAFARLLHCRAENVNVSYLAEFLEPEKGRELKVKQRALQDLAARLSAEHKATEQLLRECERLNRMMLNGIVGSANHTLTYGRAGQVRRELYRAMMSTRI